LEVKTVDDLKKMLRETGYSEDAANQILKWYERNSVDRKA
jgi:predicted Ser/Thr protein kinase